RYLLAWNHGLARALLGVYVRVLISFHRHRARRYGIRDSRSGSRSSRRASAAAQRGLGAREKALDVRLVTEDDQKRDRPGDRDEQRPMRIVRPKEEDQSGIREGGPDRADRNAPAQEHEHG